MNHWGPFHIQNRILRFMLLESWNIASCVKHTIHHGLLRPSNNHSDGVYSLSTYSMPCTKLNGMFNCLVLQQAKDVWPTFHSRLKLGKQTKQRLKIGLVCFSRVKPGCEIWARHVLLCWFLYPRTDFHPGSPELWCVIHSDAYSTSCFFSFHLPNLPPVHIWNHCLLKLR